MQDNKINSSNDESTRYENYISKTKMLVPSLSSQHNQQIQNSQHHRDRSNESKIALSQSPLKTGQPQIQIRQQFRSPHYFKHLNASSSSKKFTDYSNQTIEHYVAEQGKMLDKQMLMELARSRVKKVQKLRESKVKKEQEFTYRQTDNCMQDTKYSNFKALRMPIKHTIRGIKHPDLTLAIRLT